MKRVIVLTVLIVVGAALLGCQQGVTDVGNPSISKPPQADPASPSNPSPSTTKPGPTIAQLIGAYEVSPSDGVACQADVTRDPMIVMASDPTQIVLNYFLNYGTATDNILANYDSKTGAIAFVIDEPSIEIQSCSGTARDSAASAITISMTCRARSNDAPDCQVTFSKN